MVSFTYIKETRLLQWLSGKESACSAQAAEDSGSILGSEYLLEKEMATHSSILAWKIPWTEEPSGLHSPCGRKELDTTERVNNKWKKSLHFHISVTNNQKLKFLNNPIYITSKKFFKYLEKSLTEDMQVYTLKTKTYCWDKLKKTQMNGDWDHGLKNSQLFFKISVLSKFMCRCNTSSQNPSRAAFQQIWTDTSLDLIYGWQITTWQDVQHNGH